ncbi:hypothetical protein NECAME_12730, partial [Necator americanus]
MLNDIDGIVKSKKDVEENMKNKNAEGRKRRGGDAKRRMTDEARVICEVPPPRHGHRHHSRHRAKGEPPSRSRSTA